MIPNWYEAFMGLAPKRIPHFEHWSCPDADTFITGIDFYEHPRLCRQKMAQLYPNLHLGIPEKDDPRFQGLSSTAATSPASNKPGRKTVRWGAGTTAHWDWGSQFKTPEDVFAFSPLEHAADFATIPVIESRDYSDEQKLYKEYRARFPAEWGDKAPPREDAYAFFYNTMFMWPLLTFGWELFLECCLDDRFERVMDEFAEINRRVFRAFARLPVNFIMCHDDIVNARGPVCSPAWMHKYIFPRYEEFWGIVKAAGKEVIFMVDGCMDKYADDVLACGARGIVTEPYTDFKAIARKHKNVMLAGEGDNRVLSRNDPAEIKAMILGMIETAKITGGYMMCVGNHIPWDIPPAAIKLYLDISQELAVR